MSLLDDLESDLDDILSPEEFGLAVTYTKGQTVKPVNVLFWNGFHEGQIYGDGVDTMNPYCVGKEADFSGISGSDTLTINGTLYHIVGYEPDGMGAIKIILSKDAG